MPVQIEDFEGDLCSQLWAYDDLQTLQQSQPELSTQLGRTPAAAFCPSCGVFTLDLGATQAARDHHVSTCREHGEPEGGAHSDGEDEAAPADSSAQDSGSTAKRACTSENAGPSKERATASNLSATGSVSGCSQPHAGTSQNAVLSEASSSHQECVEVAAWLEANQLTIHGAAFQCAGVTAQLLRHLTDADLQQIGIVALGPRRKILAAIQNTVGPPAACSSGSGQGAQVGITSHACAPLQIPSLCFILSCASRKAGMHLLHMLCRRGVLLSAMQSPAARSQTSSSGMDPRHSQAPPPPAGPTRKPPPQASPSLPQGGFQPAHRVQLTMAE